MRTERSTGPAGDFERTSAKRKTSRHYHPIGIFFHWLMAVLVLSQLWWGWRMSALSAGYDKLDALILHAQLGAAILLAAGLRAGWRIIAPLVAPQLEKPEDMAAWQRRAAQVTHLLLYLTMFALPASGLVMLAATAPQILEQALGLNGFDKLTLVERARIEEVAQQIHFGSIWVMCALLAAHIGAAFKHHFIDGDDVLARMAPVLLPSEEPSGAPSSSSKIDSDRTANAIR